MEYVVYHISHKCNRESILEKGLELRRKSGSTISYEPSIFVSNSREILFFSWLNDLGKENVDVWEIKDEQPLFKDTHMSSDGHFFLKEPVLPSKIKLIISYGLFNEKKNKNFTYYHNKISKFYHRTKRKRIYYRYY